MNIIPIPETMNFGVGLGLKFHIFYVLQYVIWTIFLASLKLRVLVGRKGKIYIFITKC